MTATTLQIAAETAVRLLKEQIPQSTEQNTCWAFQRPPSGSKGFRQCNIGPMIGVTQERLSDWKKIVYSDDRRS